MSKKHTHHSALNHIDADASSALRSGNTAFDELPRGEYPRPSLIRDNWINLNGTWTYRIITRPHYLLNNPEYETFTYSHGFSDTITVPFPPESKLSGVAYTDVIPMMFYHRSISIPRRWTGGKILLHFGAVFYHSDIYIDGKLVGSHTGGSVSFSIDIAPYVQPGQDHQLVVKVRSNLFDGSQPSGKQSSFVHSYKCFYTRCTGIWQTVWMEHVPNQGVCGITIRTDIDSETIVCSPHFFSISRSLDVSISIKDGDTEVLSFTGKQAPYMQIAFSLSNMKLWHPDHPHLYDVNVTIQRENQLIDEVQSYFGCRKVHIEGDTFFLNNRPFFHRLVLDQGYYPDGVWTAASDADLRRDIELGIAAGFNGARLHQKVFEERYLYWADRLGYVVWGEMPSWGLDINNEGLAARNFLSELREEVLRDREHPALIVWTPLNETFHVTDYAVHRRLHEEAFDVCRALDPTRPVQDASGYIHHKTDIWTCHTYEQDPQKLESLLQQNGIADGLVTEEGSKSTERATNEHNRDDSDDTSSTLLERRVFQNYPEIEADYQGQPYIVDEFGGIKWDPQTQHASSFSLGQNLVSWGYGESPQSLDEFYKRLEGLVTALLRIPHVKGFCYTQLTDVEQEKNGLYYYDRSPKFDNTRIKAIIKG